MITRQPVLLAAAYREKKSGEKSAAVFPLFPVSRQRQPARNGEKGE